MPPPDGEGQTDAEETTPIEEEEEEEEIPVSQEPRATGEEKADGKRSEVVSLSVSPSDGETERLAARDAAKAEWLTAMAASGHGGHDRDSCQCADCLRSREANLRGDAQPPSAKAEEEQSAKEAKGELSRRKMPEGLPPDAEDAAEVPHGDEDEDEDEEKEVAEEAKVGAAAHRRTHAHSHPHRVHAVPPRVCITPAVLCGRCACTRRPHAAPRDQAPRSSKLPFPPGRQRMM